MRFSGTRPMAGKALADLARAEPGVHEDAGFVGFDVGAIAAGTAAEDGEFDGHDKTLMTGREPGKFFRRRPKAHRLEEYPEFGGDGTAAGHAR